MPQTFTRPRGMDEARRRAFALPEGRPSPADLPYPVTPSDPASEYLDWLPRPILGKVHQTVTPGKDGPVLGLCDRTHEWSVVGTYKGRSTPSGPAREATRKARVVRAKVQRAAQREAVREMAAPSVEVMESGVVRDGRTVALAPAIEVRNLAQRTDVAALTPAGRRAVMRARRGY